MIDLIGNGSVMDVMRILIAKSMNESVIRSCAMPMDPSKVRL